MHPPLWVLALDRLRRALRVGIVVLKIAKHVAPEPDHPRQPSAGGLAKRGQHSPITGWNARRRFLQIVYLCRPGL